MDSEAQETIASDLQSAESPLYHLVAMGFWLPCNHSAFFNHRTDLETLHTLHQKRSELSIFPDRRKELQTSVFDRLVTVLPYKGYSTSYSVAHLNSDEFKREGEPWGMLFTADPSRVRVAEVTGAQVGVDDTSASDGAQSSEQHEATTDPDEPVFRWKGAVLPEAVALLVNHSGFYLWIAVYRSGDLPEREILEHALQEHIFDVVGGAHFSHYSGLRDDEEKVGSDAERDDSLMRYRDTMRGILTFFQLNIIQEGLFNSTLDPLVFFDTQGESEQGTESQEVLKVKQKYNLRRFINMIAEPLSVKDLLPVSGGDKDASGASVHSTDHFLDEQGAANRILALARVVETLAEVGITHVGRDELAQHLFEAILSRHHGARRENERQSDVRARILTRFLRATADQSLQEIKRRIERCRRALLDEMLEITHRRLPLLQAEPPDDLEDRIDGVNETQLRGYVMVLAAKLPLITSIRLYLDNMFHGAHDTRGARPARSGEDEGVTSVHHYRPLTSAYENWNLLLSSLEHDITRLEATVEQATEDRQLQELDQIRSEEETLNELERLRSRTESNVSAREATAYSIISTVVAFVSLAFALITSSNKIPTLANIITTIERDTFPQSLPAALLLLILFAGLGALLQRVIAWLLRWGADTFFHKRQADERNYYELDLHIQAAIAQQNAVSIFDADFYSPSKVKIAQVEEELAKLERARPQKEPHRQDSPKQGQPVASPNDQHANTGAGEGVAEPPMTIAEWNQSLGKKREEVKKLAVERSADMRKVSEDFKTPVRNSYRIQRKSKDAAKHKVYIETDLLLEERVTLLKFIPFHRVRVRAILVFEIMFHRPAQNHRYYLQDLRVVINHPEVLSQQQILRVKHIVVARFVNPFLIPSERLVEPPFDERVGNHPVEPEPTDKPPDAVFTLNKTDDGVGGRRKPLVPAQNAVQVTLNATSAVAQSVRREEEWITSILPGHASGWNDDSSR